MRRFVFAIIVGLLTLSVSGVSSLVLDEPCNGLQLTASGDEACPPTCVTCGCCAQAVEPVLLVVAASPDMPIAEVSAFHPPLPRTHSRDILHVPKPRLA